MLDVEGLAPSRPDIATHVLSAIAFAAGVLHYFFS